MSSDWEGVQTSTLIYGWTCITSVCGDSKLAAVAGCSGRHSQGRRVLWRPRYRLHGLLLCVPPLFSGTLQLTLITDYDDDYLADDLLKKRSGPNSQCLIQ